MKLSSTYPLELQKVIDEESCIFGLYADKVVGETPAITSSVSSDFGREHDLALLMDVIQLRHLGVGVPLYPFPEVVSKAAELADDYFNGSWRDNTIVYYEQMDRQQCRGVLDWIDIFRQGLLAAILANNKEVICSLCQYIGPDLPTDGGAWNRNKDDRASIQLLAERVFSIFSPEAVRSPSTFNGSVSSKRAQAMVRAVNCLSSGDASNMSSSIEAIVSEYVKGEYKAGKSRVVVSWDASIVHALFAQIYGAHLEFTESLADFVVSRRSLHMDD